MKSASPPNLRVVKGSSASKGDTEAVFADMMTLREQTFAAFAAAGITLPTVTPPAAVRSRRLARSERPFARVNLGELLGDPGLFSAAARLWLVLRYRSREGQEPVRLTEQIAEEAGITPRRRWRYARQLERMGVAIIQREGRQTLTVVALSLSQRAPA